MTMPHISHQQDLKLKNIKNKKTKFFKYYFEKVKQAAIK